jgi:hypothetical protein
VRPSHLMAPTAVVAAQMDALQRPDWWAGSRACRGIQRRGCATVALAHNHGKVTNTYEQPSKTHSLHHLVNTAPPLNLHKTRGTGPTPAPACTPPSYLPCHVAAAERRHCGRGQGLPSGGRGQALTPHLEAVAASAAAASAVAAAAAATTAVAVVAAAAAVAAVAAAVAAADQALRLLAASPPAPWPQPRAWAWACRRCHRHCHSRSLRRPSLRRAGAGGRQRNGLTLRPSRSCCGARPTRSCCHAMHGGRCRRLSSPAAAARVRCRQWRCWRRRGRRRRRAAASARRGQGSGSGAKGEGLWGLQRRVRTGLRFVSSEWRAAR